MSDPLRLDSPATLYVPSPIHEDAYTRARELGFDILLPDDARLNQHTWQDLTDAVVLRQGKLSGSYHDAKKLKIVARNGTGYDTVDIPACKQLGIAATNLPGFNARAVGEHVLALTLAITRRIPESCSKMKAGQKLISMNFVATSLDGKTLGLVGQGNIARETARRFIGAFNCKILVYSPTSPAERWTSADPNGHVVAHTRVDSLEALLQQSDVVSLHAPSTPSTQNMMNATTFAQMKQGAVFINTARGELVDEEALVHSLKSGHLSGAGLDVLKIEPATTKDYAELFGLENVVVTPHLGGTTEDIARLSTIKAVETCAAFLKGLPVEHRIV